MKREALETLEECLEKVYNLLEIKEEEPQSCGSLPKGDGGVTDHQLHDGPSSVASSEG